MLSSGDVVIIGLNGPAQALGTGFGGQLFDGSFAAVGADITWTSEMSWFLPLATGLGIPEAVETITTKVRPLKRVFAKKLSAQLLHRFALGPALPPAIPERNLQELGCVFFFFPKLVGRVQRFSST